MNAGMTLFREVVGDNPRIRVLEFFLETRELDFGVGDVAEETELSRQTAYTIIEEFYKKDLLIINRTLKNKQLYKLNLKSSVIQKWILLFDGIVFKDARISKKLTA